MIFLDIEVPEYQSMRTQEHKIPELLKTIRGRGTIERNNEYGYDERLHLSFTVNEKNLVKFLKVYARFQTLCLIPMFNKNLKKKVYDSYLQYKKRTLSNMLENVDVDKDKVDKIVEKSFNEKNEEVYLKAISDFGYKVNPNATDCMMVFLESFSFKSIQDSSDGYELEMILWVCNDLTFYNGAEIDFLEDYYTSFSAKDEAFKEIDEKIDNMFLDENIIDNLNIQFDNSFNNQETYNPNKAFEKIEVPIDINIPSRYIVQAEVRAMNNLRRIPIVGKTKGFIQHLGKGEIGITVKLALNQKNALEEKIIHDIKSVSLYQQEYITTSNTDFYLFKGMDIKELSMSTNIIEEPSDDVDITIVTIFFVGSGVSKQELDNNYFKLMDRGNTNINLKLFNLFLDRILSNENYIDTEVGEGTEPDNKNIDYKTQLNHYLGMIISKSDKEGFFADRSESDFSNGGDIVMTENGYFYGANYTTPRSNLDFTIKTLAKSYLPKHFPSYLFNLNNGNENSNSEDDIENIEPLTGVLTGMGEFLHVGGVPVDSEYIQSIMYRIQRVAFMMKNEYTKEKTDGEKEDVIIKITNIDNENQNEFVSKIFSNFLAEFFDVKFMTNEKNMLAFSVSTVFKIEVINNIVLLVKNMMDKDFTTHNLISHDNGNTIMFSENGKFNEKIKNMINVNVKICFNSMKEIMNTDSFMNKVKDFVLTNYYRDVDNKEFIETLEKGIKAEIEKAINRVEKLTDEMYQEENYIIYITEIMFKLQVLGCRSEAYNLFNSGMLDNKTLSRDPAFTLTTEMKIYLLTTCIISLFVADLNFEKSVVGVLAAQSAKNFIGPHAVTYTAIDVSLGEILASLKKITNGKTVDEYLSDTGKKEDDPEIAYVMDYKRIYDVLYKLKKIYQKTFGSSNLEELKKLNQTFVRANMSNKDFQKIHGVRVFEGFDSPMSFLKKISNNSAQFKNIMSMVNKDLVDLDESATSTNLVEFLTSSITNKDENGEGIVTNDGLNVSGSSDIDKLINSVVTVFTPAIKLIMDKTTNKHNYSAIMPTSYMQTALLGEFKLLRGLRSATRLLNYQYERMMPDYEVYVIDEKYVERAKERGYDYQDKIYSISNIISVNIKKDDTTNLKHAVIKILNTTPHYVGLDTIFESQSVFNQNESPDVVYSNKFVTQKLVFRAGMIVNVSINQSSQFFDFTGRIDSVELTSSVITLKCSSFAAELLGESFDMANVYATGLSSAGTRLKNLYRQFLIDLEIIKNSKNGTLNSHIIPEGYIEEIIEKDKSNKKVVAGASGIVYTALANSIKSIKHLDCPYNPLTLGRNLSKNVSGTIGKGASVVQDIGGDVSETTSHRVSENINAIEYDLTFYGLQNVTFTTQQSMGPVDALSYIDGSISGKKDKMIISHSSFIPKTLQENVADFDTIKSVSKVSWLSKETTEPAFFGYCYSYKRNDVKMYDVLNDVALRNPGSYWDVFESGNYGTLFLGRSNYNIVRKNKTASLSREDIDEISSVAVELFSKDPEFKLRYMPIRDYTDTINCLAEFAALYDTNFSKDKNILKGLNSKLIADNRMKSKYHKSVAEFNKDFYNEVSTATNIIMAVSGYNLVSCSIKTNEEYFNAIDVKYKPGLGDRFDRLKDFVTGKSSKIRLKSFEGLSDERLRVKAIDPVLTTNLHTKEQAFEYAQSVMFKELTNYYSGKIVILYHPDIKKNDEVLIIDSRNKINGIVVVRDFEHILDSDVGAITIITPGMKVTTSSLMTDVYLTGMINKLTYEWLKMDTAKVSSDKINEINKSAGATLRDMLGDTFKNINQVPVAFEYTGFNFEFDEDDYEYSTKTDNRKAEVFLKTDKNKNGVKGTEVNYEEHYKTPDTLLTPRNISSLPFKLYPLIKNGKALIPDEDIYNSMERPFSSVIKLLTSLSYLIYNAFDFGNNIRNAWELIKDLWEDLDTSSNSVFEAIVKKYMPAFKDEYYQGQIRDGISSKEIFLNKMLDDNYYGKLLSKLEKINTNPGIWDKESVVFFNCKQLRVDETERINEIARILCQFTIVNVVELNSQTPSGEFENNNFSVVEALRAAMEDYSKKLIKKSNRNCTSWTTSMQARLIDEPTGNYDDIGAVFINCNKEIANKIIAKQQVVELEADMDDYFKQNKNEDQNKYPFVKTVRRNAMRYTIKPNKMFHKTFRTIHAFVFHNYFGENLGSESLSYEIRRRLLDKLIKEIKDSYLKNNSIVLGDFNLRLTDFEDKNFFKENANSGIYNIAKKGFVKVIRDTTTTDGNAFYDQIFTSEELAGMINKGSVIRFEKDKITKKIINKDTGEEEVEYIDISDHYPIYLFFKEKVGIPGNKSLNILPKKYNE